MVTGARDQRQLDLADHLVCAVSLNLQQRRRQPRKAYPPPGAYPVASPVVPAHSSSSSSSTCHSDVSTCPPLLMRGTSSGTAVRLGQPPTLPRGSADLVCHSTRPAVIATSSSLNGRATSAAAAAANSCTAQQRSADMKGLKGYCNPARRLSGVESLEQGPKQEMACFAQQLRSTQLGRTADGSEESLNAPHPIAVSY